MPTPLPWALFDRLRHGVSALAAAGVLCASLGGCAAGFSTQASRIGPDDGTDSCRKELVALDSTGNFFGEDILKGAVIGMLGGGALGGAIGSGWRDVLLGAGAGAAAGAVTAYWVALQEQGRDQKELMKRVRDDLERENAEIDRTQAAFDALSECRFRQAQTVRAAYTKGQISRATAAAQMEQGRTRAQRDLQLARLINDKIAGRGAQLEVAADNLSPGTRLALDAAKSAPPRAAVVRRATPIKLRPNPASPDLASLRPRQRVLVVTTRGNHALVQTGDGERGYASLSDLEGAAGRGPIEAQVAGGPVRTLASGNAALRDDFAASVSVTQQAAAKQFELGGS